MPTEILTIGHSNHTWEAFVALLKQHGVEVLADVRSEPVSKYAPYASSRMLPQLLERENIRYVFLGDTLGGKPSDRTSYDRNGKPDYWKIRSNPSFEARIAELVGLAGEVRVAIMCAEEDPGKCHRRLLLGPALDRVGVTSRHIRADGAVHTGAELGNKRAYQRQLQTAFPLDEPDQ